MGRMPMLLLCAAATSAPLIPGQTVLVRYRPQKSGTPSWEATCGYRPLPALASPVNDLQESTPQRVREVWTVGVTRPESAWMSTSLGGAAARCSSRLRTLLSARCTEPTAARNDGIAPVIVTSAAHVFPLLQNGATSCPWLSKMPMLHGLSVMSALAMATTCTTAPGCVLFVPACTLSDSQCTRKISVCATTSSDGGAVGVGGARTATTARVPPTGNVMVTRQVFPLAQ